MSTYKEVRVEMVTLVELGTREGLKRLLEALESIDLAPTHAGLREDPKDAYDRAAFISTVVDKGSTVLVPSIVRRSHARYTGLFTARRGDLSTVKLAFRGDSGATPYTAADTLAGALEPEFGFVHPILAADDEDWNDAGHVKAPELQKVGIFGLCARTIVGPHVAGLFGAARLAEAGARTTSWGGAILDLASRPWDASVDAMRKRRDEAKAALAPAGIFGDFDEETPGPRWKPIPAGN